MKKLPEADMLDRVCGAIRVEGSISDTHVGLLETTFGPKAQRAFDALEEGRVKKYIFSPSGRIVWIVVGKERDYLVMPASDYCSCDDFYYQFDHGHLCYHIIAQKLADATGRFDLFEDDDEFFDILIREWKSLDQNPSSTEKREEHEEDTV
jgi:predicted nucleic acid-binding Zn finger protein